MAHTNGHGAPRPQGPSQHCFALGMWGVVLHCWRSVLCLLSPVPRVIQFRLPAPWEQEGQFQPPSSLWMWIRGSLGVCLRIEEVARGRTRKRTKAARQNRTAVGPSPPRVTCEAGRLPTPARSQPEPLRPVTPSPQRLRRGGRLASLRPQSQRSPPAPPSADCVRLLLEDSRFQSSTGLDRTLACISPFGARPWKPLLAQGPEAGGQKGTCGRAGSPWRPRGHLHQGSCWCCQPSAGPPALTARPLPSLAGRPHHQYPDRPVWRPSGLCDIGKGT